MTSPLTIQAGMTRMIRNRTASRLSGPGCARIRTGYCASASSKGGYTSVSRNRYP